MRWRTPVFYCFLSAVSNVQSSGSSMVSVCEHRAQCTAREESGDCPPCVPSTGVPQDWTGSWIHTHICQGPECPGRGRSSQLGAVLPLHTIHHKDLLSLVYPTCPAMTPHTRAQSGCQSGRSPLLLLLLTTQHRSGCWFPV